MIFNSLDVRLLGRLVLLVTVLAGGGYAALHHAYGLALAGEAGVAEVIRNVVAEFDLTLGLLGAHAARDLGPDHLA